MTDLPSVTTIHEMIEDRLEEKTGEPRHVTDIEIELIPEQDNAANWSPNCTCKPEYRDALDDVLDDIEAAYPEVDWGAKD